MDEMGERDIIIIGSGPAGLSAAINAKVRNKNVLVISNDPSESWLYKAEKINNYLGLPGVSGKELIEAFNAHAAGSGIDIVHGKVLNVMPFGDVFMVGYGSEVVNSKAVIIAAGVVQSVTYKGEQELLGRGVSYCATCDGMLYRGKTVCVAGDSPDLKTEVDYLKEIGCNVQQVEGKIIEIKGSAKLETVITDRGEIPCDGLFVLRKTIAFDTLMPGIENENGHIRVNRSMETSVKGVFAAGDCTGKPLQVAKAVGEGLVAGLAAAGYIDELAAQKK